MLTRQPKVVMTNQEIQRRWLHHLQYNRELSQHSLRAYRSDSQNYIDYLETISKSLTNSDKQSVRGWFRTLLAPPRTSNKKSISAATLSRKRASIRSIYQWMISQQLRNNDPTSLVPLPKIPKRNPKFMSIPEAANVVENPSQTGDFQIRNQAILELIYGAGLRVAETANLDVPHIDLIQRLVHVVNGKGGKDRLVPFGPPAATAIQRMFEQTTHPKVGPVFLNRFGRRLSTRSIWQICHDSGRENGVFGLHPHAFRHSCATHLLDSGASLRVIQEQLGHSSLSTTQRYTQVNTAALLEAYRQSHPRLRSSEPNPKR